MILTIGAELDGPAGHATELLASENTLLADWRATIGVWMLWCPGQSPFWDLYRLSAVHLRPIEGQQYEPKLWYPEATHEIQLVALNPEKCVIPVMTDTATWEALIPYNLIEQVTLPDDASAATLLAQAAMAVVDGKVWAEPPLSGQVEPWRGLLQGTAAHFRGEHQ